MPNIGAPELIIILVIALLILGPGKLPEVGASIGKSLREFRKASSDVQEATKIDVSVAPIARPRPPRRPRGVAPATAPVAAPASPMPMRSPPPARPWLPQPRLPASPPPPHRRPWRRSTEPADALPASESTAASH